MHIGIFGLSGSGKTTLAKEFSDRNPEYSAISASHLISLLGGVVEYNSLNPKNIDSNQHTLVIAYEKYKLDHPRTIIELHCIIETETGVTIVDPEVLKSLNLDIVFFLRVPAEEIFRRRAFDTRKARRIVSPSELAKLQELSLSILRKAFSDKPEILDSHCPIDQIERTIHINRPT